MANLVIKNNNTTGTESSINLKATNVDWKISGDKDNLKILKNGTQVAEIAASGFDASLTQADQAAQAKAVGDKISSLESSSNALTNAVSEINETLDSKVDKISGKGLSTNDFTTAYKNKLDGIESQATKTIVDNSLSDSSTNPVQNKVVKTRIDAVDSDLVATKTSLSNHISNKDNPHGVTAAQVGAVPTGRTVNGKVLSANITLNASDVGADPAGTGASQATSKVSAHNTSSTAHADLRTAINAKADKENGVFYIEGTGTTAGAWLGSCDDITTYYDGLTIIYKIGIAGVSSGTTLNINNLGAVSVIRNSSTAVTTHYGVNSILVLTYTTVSGTPYWKLADYDSDTKTRSSNKTGSKMYIIGAITQKTSGQTTYSNSNCYIGKDNCLYSEGKKVATAEEVTSVSNSLSSLNTQVSNFLNVNDDTKDQLSEVLELIDANKGTLESLTTSKVSKTDIQNNLTSSDIDKPLSANQGKILKDLIDEEIEAHDEDISTINNSINSISQKLNTIENGANKYILPEATSSTLGGVKIGSNISNSSGTISLTKANIVAALGYTPPQTDTNTTYSEATDSVYGLVKTGYVLNGKNYPVKLSEGKMYVNVPWTDNNTTYGVVSTTADGLAPKRDGSTTKFLRGDGSWATPPNTTYSNATTTTAGLMSVNDKKKLDGIAENANNYTYTLPTASSSTLGGVKTTSTVSSTSGLTACPIISGVPYYKDTNTTYSKATSDTYGLVKIGYSENNKNYPVELNNDGQMFVNVPWTDTDTNTTYTSGTGISINGTVINHKNSVTASTASGGSGTKNFGDTFTIPKISYDSQGHITGATITTVTLPSDRLFVTLVPTGTTIPANANLNTPTYMKVGRYFCSKTADAKTIQNCPVNVAFMMEVYSPLSTTIDNETTGTWVYRIRKITAYNTGMQFIQYASVGATANVWTYGDWKVQPIANFTLDTTDKNGGSAAIGSATNPVYVDSTGTIQKTTYTLGKSVPSDAVFTDTKYTNGTGITLTGNEFSITSSNVSTMINLLGEGTSPAEGEDYLIAQYAGGGTSNKSYYRRKVKNIITAENVKIALGTGTGTTKYLREDGTWVVPPNTTYSKATSDAYGLVKIGYSGFTTINQNYPVQLDSDGKMYVNVPWTDTTYTVETLGAAPASHTHTASNITSGIFPLEIGGTGSSELKNAPNHAIIYKMSNDNNNQLWYTATKKGAFFATETDGYANFGTLPINCGGTGATTAAGILTNLGVTATATELNYVDGVTSNIQTQLNTISNNIKVTSAAAPLTINSSTKRISIGNWDLGTWS